MKEKLIINTNLLRKESEFRTKSCVVEKAIAVSNVEFENMKRHPLRDNPQRKRTSGVGKILWTTKESKMYFIIQNLFGKTIIY